MSRGRPRHRGSRRRAYSSRQREVRERRVRLAREEFEWEVDPMTAIEEAPPDEPRRSWTLPLQGRSAAA